MASRTPTHAIRGRFIDVAKPHNGLVAVTFAIHGYAGADPADEFGALQAEFERRFPCRYIGSPAPPERQRGHRVGARRLAPLGWPETTDGRCLGNLFNLGPGAFAPGDFQILVSAASTCSTPRLGPST